MNINCQSLSFLNFRISGIKNQFVLQARDTKVYQSSFLKIICNYIVFSLSLMKTSKLIRPFVQQSPYFQLQYQLSVSQHLYLHNRYSALLHMQIFKQHVAAQLSFNIEMSIHGSYFLTYYVLSLHA